MHAGKMFNIEKRLTELDYIIVNFSLQLQKWKTIHKKPEVEERKSTLKYGKV